MKLSSLSVNAELLEQGDWVDDIPECGDLRIKTRGINNAAWKKLQQQKIAALPRRQRRGSVDPATSERIANECLVETCLLGWENLVGDEGQPIAFDKKRALELLADPRYAPFRDACFWAAGQVADDATDDRDDAAKNSATA